MCIRDRRCGEWKYGDQDGGAGHVGTVCLPSKITTECLPHGMVFVAWDSGVIANYWYDINDDDLPCDLRVFDNRQTGSLQCSHLCKMKPLNDPYCGDVMKHCTVRTGDKYRSWVLVKCVWCGAYY